MSPEDSKIISYQRDRFVETSELVFPFLDDISGTIRGYRIFTACRTVRGKIFRLENHLDRLYYSASGIYMNPPLPKEDLRELLSEVVRKNREAGIDSDLLIDVIFSGGLAASTMKQSSSGAHLYIAVQELIPPPAECYEKGVSLATFPYQRMFPDVKLLNYVGAILAHQTVVPSHDAYEVVFVSPPDLQTILEGSTFTIFFVDSQGDILTPPLDGRILDSVTRRVVFEVVGQTTEMRIREAPVSLGRLASFQEAFLASTTRNLLPVVRIDDMVIGSGKPGPRTLNLMDLFQQYLDAY
ncbi:MAG: aminotransferase class IV [Desulfomonilaceae bacterium]